MIPSRARWTPIHESKPDQFTEKGTRVLFDLISLLIVSLSEFIHDLVDAMGPITHLPDRSAHLVDRDCKTGVFLKKQNSLIG
jgi:hypothetical protein